MKTKAVCSRWRAFTAEEPMHMCMWGNVMTVDKYVTNTKNTKPMQMLERHALKHTRTKTLTDTCAKTHTQTHTLPVVNHSYCPSFKLRTVSHCLCAAGIKTWAGLLIYLFMSFIRQSIWGSVRVTARLISRLLRPNYTSQNTCKHLTLCRSFPLKGRDR